MMDTINPDTLAALAALGPVALWLLAVGFFSPLVIAVIQQTRWSPRRQAVVAFLFYVVVAAVTAWLQGIFTAFGIVTAFLVIFVTAATAYRNLWKPTGIAPAIQNATPIAGTAPQTDTVDDTIAEYPTDDAAAVPADEGPKHSAV
jgi:hypothetical protein